MEQDDSNPETMYLSTNNRAVMGGNKQLKNCSRMAILSHMIAGLIAGMLIGYSLTVTDIDRDKLEREITQYNLDSDLQLHRVNETFRMWKGVQIESVEVDLNEFEAKCIEHGSLDNVMNGDNNTVIANILIPYQRRFAGIAQSFLPAVNFEVMLNQKNVVDLPKTSSQVTFLNNITRSDMMIMQFEASEIHILDKKTLCYFVFQREKRVN